MGFSESIPQKQRQVTGAVISAALLSGCFIACTAGDQPPDARSLTIRLVDAETQDPVSGVVRITRKADGARIKIPQLIQRENGWYTTQPVSTITVPATDVTIEAVRGLQTETATVEVDLARESDVTLQLRRFYNASQRGWRNANTHLHIMKRSRKDAERYLREVPDSDGLELVFLSHLRRIPDETTYISNQIVEESLPGDALRKLSTKDVVFAPGEEHRHNFGRGGEGFGHVMLLNITKLIRPVSIGPGIMRSGSDSRPLQHGIRDARSDGATVVWCHNANGFEDIPNWMSGTLHAQNIFDGGNRGSYQDSFYRYLNLGMQIPFSTGTDWFIDDFSRVYAPLQESLTAKSWLKQLREGKTFITNGPLLEFEVDGHGVGHVLRLEESRTVKVVAKAVGRSDFQSIELIRNGDVIGRAVSRKNAGHYEATLHEQLHIDEPCWLAIRTPVENRKNLFGKPIYAHSSPVYFEYQGHRIFKPEVALGLIAEIEASVQVIREKAVFANDAEDHAVMDVYREGISILQARLLAFER